MNYLANNQIAIGAPCSPARYKSVKNSRGHTICLDCIRKHETNKKTLIISIGLEECNVCETAQNVCYTILA